MGLKFDLDTPTNSTSGVKKDNVTGNDLKPELLPGGGFKATGKEDVAMELNEFCNETLKKIQAMGNEISSIKKKIEACEKGIQETRAEYGRQIKEISAKVQAPGDSIWNRINPIPATTATIYRLVEKAAAGGYTTLADFDKKEIAEGALAIAKSEGRKDPEILELLVWKKTDGAVGNDVTLEDYVKIHQN